MKKFKRKPKVLTPEQAEEIRVQEFFDRVAPSTVKFFKTIIYAETVIKVCGR